MHPVSQRIPADIKQFSRTRLIAGTCGKSLSYQRLFHFFQRYPFRWNVQPFYDASSLEASVKVVNTVSLKVAIHPPSRLLLQAKNIPISLGTGKK
jgi:hypothetical protein